MPELFTINDRQTNKPLIPIPIEPDQADDYPLASLIQHSSAYISAYVWTLASDLTTHF